MPQDPFWKHLALNEMNREQWESLCDGCGKCCLIKLEDEDSGCIHYTSVVCRYLDQQRCRCKVYTRRCSLVPTCVELHPDELDTLHWMPSTCAYRLLHEGKPLPLWHPLISGSRRAMVAAGVTVTGKVVSEDYIHDEDLQTHVVEWPQ